MADVQDRVHIHPVDFWEELSYFFKTEYKVTGGALAVALMMDDEGQIYYSAIFAVYFLPVLTCIAFYYLMKSAFTVDDNIKE